MNLKTHIFLLLCLCSLIIVAGCAGNDAGSGYEISGIVRGLDSGMVKLEQFNDSDRTVTTIDSARFTGGEFSMKGRLQTPAMLTLVFEPGNWQMPVFAENSKITIDADTSGAFHYDQTAYGGSKGSQFKTFTVSGSSVQDDLNTYQNNTSLKAFDQKFEQLQEEYSAAGDNKELAEQVKERTDSLRTVMNAMQVTLIDSFASAKPASAAGPYMLNYYYMFNEALPLDTMEAITKKFSGMAQSTPYYRQLTTAIQKRKALQPGNVAPDFTLLKPDSSKLTLSSLRGSYIMLDFWASWCVPCRKAIPHWKDMYAKYHDKGFNIVSITNDTEWKEWFKALDAEKMPWPQVADEFPVKNMPARVIEEYMAPYLPTYVLLDKDGKIILHNGTEAEIDVKLKEIFGS